MLFHPGWRFWILCLYVCMGRGRGMRSSIQALPLMVDRGSGGVACWTKHYGWSHYRRHYCMLLHSHSLMQRLECPLIFIFQKRGMFLLEEIVCRIDSADPLIKNFCKTKVNFCKNWTNSHSKGRLCTNHTYVHAKMKKYLYILGGMSEVS